LEEIALQIPPSAIKLINLETALHSHNPSTARDTATDAAESFILAADGAVFATNNPTTRLVVFGSIGIFNVLHSSQ
jgi:hypothetical protein